MPQMTELELKKTIKSKEIGNVYFLYGEEKYLLSFYKKKLISCVISDIENSFNLQMIKGEISEVNKIIESVEALPLMSNKKCVVVDDIELESLKDNEIEELSNLISDVPDYCVLIFSFSTIDIGSKKSSKYKKVIKQCEKFGFSINFKKIGNIALEKQLINWAKKKNITLTNSNASKIIRLCGNDLQTLKNELEKLCAYVFNGEITEEIIEGIVTKNLETTVFVLSNAVASGDYTSAYKQFDRLLYQKEEPIAILAVLSSVYIDMYRVKVFIENEKDPQSLKESFDYKGKEFRIKNAIRNSKYLSLTMIKESLSLLLRADMDLKSLKIDKRIIMEELITKLLLLYKKERHC